MLCGILICLAAYLFFCVSVGLHGSIESSLYQPPDSAGYKAVATWIYHGGPAPGAAAKRPFFYPLILGLPLMIGPWAIWLFNICCWFGTIFLTARAVHKLTASHTASLIVWMAFSLNISLMDLTMRALPELPLVFVLSLWAWRVTSVGFENPSVWDLASLVLLMVTATLIKPLFQLHVLLLLIVFPFIPSIRRLFRRRPLGLLASIFLVLLPLVPQVIIVRSLTGTFALSTAGSEELKRYIIPEVVLRLNSPLAWGDRRQMIEKTREEISDCDSRECVQLVAQHPLLLAKTLTENIFRDNLMEGCLAFEEDYLLFAFSKLHNSIITVLHIYMMPIVLLIAAARGIRGPKINLLFLVAAAALIIVTSGLVFWAGDRIIVIAEPLWLTAYLAASWMVCRHPGIGAVLLGEGD